MRREASEPTRVGTCLMNLASETSGLTGIKKYAHEKASHSVTLVSNKQASKSASNKSRTCHLIPARHKLACTMKLPQSKTTKPSPGLVHEVPVLLVRLLVRDLKPLLHWHFLADTNDQTRRSQVQVWGRQRPKLTVGSFKVFVVANV